MGIRTKAGTAELTLDLHAIGRLLRVARDNLRYSYRELGERCGVSATQVVRMEGGDFEYSVQKLNRICFALGLPVGDVMEFGTRRKLPAVGWDYQSDPRITALVGEPDSQGHDARFKRVTTFAGSVFSLAFVCLTSSRPLHHVLSEKFPVMRMAETFPEFALMVEDMSNVERLSLLRALQQSPIQKLTSLRLLDFDALKTYMEGKSAWSYSVAATSGGATPNSVAQTLGRTARD